MRIGFDTIGIQSPGRSVSESARIALRLLRSLLERDSPHRFILYRRDGLTPFDLPLDQKAVCRRLSEDVSRHSNGRPPIQEILDRNPDGLDWLVLLDPFHAEYRGQSLEVRRNRVKVASLIADFAPIQLDRHRLALLHDHDMIVVASEETGDELTRRCPSLAGRIVRLGIGIDESWGDSKDANPCPERLGDLGIVGPFLFANLAADATRSNLGYLLEAYGRLPSDLRDHHQLVIAGDVGDPWAAMSLLQECGGAEGLVLVGRVDDPTLRLLYGKCATFVSPGLDGAPAHPLLEAMACGAAVVAGRSGIQSSILADVGLLVDPADPVEIASQVARLLSDDELNRGLRQKAVARAEEFPWKPVVDQFLSALGEVTSTAPVLQSSIESSSANRSDDGENPWFEESFNRFDFREQGVGAHQSLLDLLSRQFATIHVLSDVFSIKSKLKRLRRRPGLAYLIDESSLDRIEPRRGSGYDIEAEVACQRLFELFLTRSSLAVRSARAEAAILSRFPEFADQIERVSVTRSVWPVLESDPSADHQAADEGISGENSRHSSIEQMTGLTPLSLNV